MSNRGAIRIVEPPKVGECWATPPSDEEVAYLLKISSSPYVLPCRIWSFYSKRCN